MGDSTSTTYTGTISGTGGLTKLGAGTQTLSGALTYTGATTLTAGTLQVNGSLVAGPTITVPGGATLGVGTGGSVARKVIVSGGTVNLAGTLPAGTTLTLTTGTVNSTGTGGTAAIVTLPAQNSGPVLSALTNQELSVTSKLSQNDGGVIVTAGTVPFKVGGTNVVNSVGSLILQGGTTTVDNIVSNIAPGLDVRGWQGVNNIIEGTTFALPGSPTHSSSAGTLGYATGAINLDGSNHEHFTSSGQGSSGVLSGPLPTGYVDHYTVEYRGKLKIDTSGNYRFSTTSDDGSALWIDAGDVATANPAYSTAAVQSAFDQGMTRRDSASSYNLSAGYHDFIVRFWENGGGNGLFVRWDPTGGTNMVDIPGSQFFHGSSTTGAVSMLTTNVKVTADSTLKANFASTASFGDVTLTAGVLSFETATAMSFSNIAATGDSEIASGVPITVRSNGTVNVAAGKTLTMSANMTGTVTKTGSGTLLINGTKTYTGVTTIADGTLSVANIVIGGGASDLGNATSAVVLGDATHKGTLSYTGNSANFTRGFTVLAGGGEIDNTSVGQTLVIQKTGTTGTITGTNVGLTIGGDGDTTIITNVGLGATSGALTKTGAGILNIFSGVQTYKTLTTSAGAGPTYVNTALGTGTTSVVANANLSFGTVSQKLGSLTIGAGATVTFTSGLATGLQPLTTGYYLGTFSGNLGVWSASNGAGSNWTSDAAGLAVTALTPIAATDVIFSASGASNQSAMTLGKEMAINSMTVTGDETNNLSLAATGGYSLTIGSTTNPGLTIQAGAGNVTLNPKIKLGLDQSWTNNGSNALTVGGTVDNRGFLLTVAGSGTANITGAISGSGGLTKINAGMLTLAGASTYTGPTTISAGAITTGVNSTSTNGPLGFNAAVALANGFGAELNIANNVSIGSLTGGGRVYLTVGKTLTVGGDNTSPAAYAGVISQTGTPGAGALTKVGTGTLALGGVNTYTGLTTVTSGTLQVNGSLATASQVNVGTAGTLAGSGTIKGNVTLTGSGIINLTGGTIQGTLGITGGNWNGSGSVTGLATSTSGTLTIASGASLAATGGLNVTGGSLGGTGTLTGSLLYTSNSSSMFGGVIAGSNKTVTLTGAASSLSLGSANTYTGATAINAGTLLASSVVVSGGASSLGDATSAVVLGDATTKGTLSYTGNSAVYIRGFTVLTGGGQIETINSGQTLTIQTGTITGTNVGLTISGSGNTTLATAVGLGATGGALIKTGTGILNINNGATPGTQIYKTLTTTLGAGTTNVNSPIGTGNTAVTANAKIKFGSVSQKLASLTIGAGATVTFTSGTATGSFSGGGLDGKAPGSAVIPEPGSIGLLLAGSLGLLASRRKRPVLE